MKSNNKVYLISGLIVVILISAVVIGLSISGNNNGAPSISANPSAPASLALITDGNSQTAAVGDVNQIRWTSNNYAASTVSINLIRKVSDNPAQYELVRQITASTPNTGDFAWTPSASDVGPNTYIQVACTVSDQACTATPLPPQPVESN